MTSHTRKKQPDVLRRALLDHAARLATERGLTGITVQAVAEAAGVTKGGLFHHFPSKQALIEGVFVDLLTRLDADIDAHLRQDDEQYGRFTRAYVAVTFADLEPGHASAWAVLSGTTFADPALGRLWESWMNKRLERHRDTDHAPILEIARFAADGLWLTQAMQHDGSRMSISPGLYEELIALTRPRPSSS